MRTLVSNSYDEVKEALRDDGEKRLEAFKAFNSEFLVGDSIKEDGRRHSLGGSPKQNRSLAQVLGDLNGRLKEWDSTSRTEARNWREQAESLRWQLDEQTRQAKSWSSSAEECQSKASEL